MEAEKYPIGIQSFEKVITGGYIYIDKTEQIYNLVNGGGYYFLSRPRRFGKSLLLSTIQAYYEGRKDLFEGLAISRLETEWDSYPVIKLSMSMYNPTEGNLKEIIEVQLAEYERNFNIENKIIDLSSRFRNLILEASRQTEKTL